jgi:very-short-patch-repair endonuclease
MSKSHKNKIPWNLGKHHTIESKLKMSEAHKNQIPWIKGKHHTKETKDKIGEKNRGKISRKGYLNSEETRKKISNSNIGKHKNSEEFKQKLRKKCLDGHAIIMIKSIKRISKQEEKLGQIIKFLYQDCVFQDKIFNYAIDITIPKYKIAIEYDGWYHFDTEEHKEYHKYRQKRIESEGWKFLRYNIFQKFPTKEQIKEDIYKIIG